MKLGLISAILGDLNFEEMIDFLAECGLECVKLPAGQKEKQSAAMQG